MPPNPVDTNFMITILFKDLFPSLVKTPETCETRSLAHIFIFRPATTMPIVDLDDELSVVGEEKEEDALESPMDAFSDVDHSLYSGMKSDASAMEEMSTAESQDGGEQQWIIDSIMNHKKDDSPEGMNVSGSETDDSSLYLTEMDNLEESVRNPESKQVTPKTKNQKKAAAVSQR